MRAVIISLLGIFSEIILHESSLKLRLLAISWWETLSIRIFGVLGKVSILGLLLEQSLVAWISRRSSISLILSSWLFLGSHQSCCWKLKRLRVTTLVSKEGIHAHQHRIEEGIRSLLIGMPHTKSINDLLQSIVQALRDILVGQIDWSALGTSISALRNHLVSLRICSSGKVSLLQWLRLAMLLANFPRFRSNLHPGIAWIFNLLLSWSASFFMRIIIEGSWF